MTTTRKSEVIASVCAALDEAGVDAAVRALELGYPFAPQPIIKRRSRATAYTSVFARDGFVDRYSGERLVFLPALRLLSHTLGARFPYHPNWKTDVTHPAYWEIGATIDHVVPVARGGADEPDNWVTTSMARNSAKMNWTIEELGWELRPSGNFSAWDGLLRWSVEYGRKHPEAVIDTNLRAWLSAAEAVLANLDDGGR